MAPEILPNISPIIKRVALSVIFRDIKMITSRIDAEPIPAASNMLILLPIMAIGIIEPSKIIRATPKLAPELIPRTNGPANGFLNRVCINRPLTASPAPTPIAEVLWVV